MFDFFDSAPTRVWSRSGLPVRLHLNATAHQVIAGVNLCMLSLRGSVYNFMFWLNTG